MTIVTVTVILLLVGIAFHVWVVGSYRAAHEAWKSYALAIEVEMECLEEYYEHVENEGCGTRSKRRARIETQWGNAKDAAANAMDTLVLLGEYQ